MEDKVTNEQYQFLLELTPKLADKDSTLWSNLQSIQPMSLQMLHLLVNSIDDRTASCILDNIEVKVGLDIIKYPNPLLLELIKLIGDKLRRPQTMQPRTPPSAEDSYSNSRMGLLAETQVASETTRPRDKKRTCTCQSVYKCLDRFCHISANFMMTLTLMIGLPKIQDL